MLGRYLFMAYNHTRTVEVLNESITLHFEVLGVESARLMHFATIRQLIESLSSRWRLFRRKSDLDEIMERFASGVEDTYAMVPLPIRVGMRLGIHSANFRTPFTPNCIRACHASLMQSSLVFCSHLA